MRALKTMAAGATIALLLTSCDGKRVNNPDDTNSVDVVNVIEDLTEITTSMLGKNIRFVPLETTDSALVGRQWTTYVTDDRIVISNVGMVSFAGQQADVMVFDINTGKFITKLGQQGGGPEDYSSAYTTLDIKGKNAYFTSSNGNGWVKYDLDGNFKGKALADIPSAGKMVAYFSDSTVCLIDAPTTDSSRRMALTTYGFSGTLLDSIVAFDGQQAQPFSLTIDGQISIWSHEGPFKNTRNSIGSIRRGDETILIFPGTTIYPVGNEIHLKEKLCDTIYNISQNGLEPSLIFNLGDERFPFQDFNKRPIEPTELILSDIIESPDHVLFAVSRGLPESDDKNTYIGHYNRTTGAITMTSGAKGIIDDLSHFMPFNPIAITTSGTFVGVLTSEAIDDWMEAHPDTELPAALADWDIEDNPVLVLID